MFPVTSGQHQVTTGMVQSYQHGVLADVPEQWYCFNPLLDSHP